MPTEVTDLNPRFGRRHWVKLWVNEWLDGTTRFEMSDAQRAFWIDLLAMAGRSRVPGIVCAGAINGVPVGYPINKFQSLLSEPIDIEATFQLFEKNGKIKVEITQEIPIKLYKLELLNWAKYQSEYQRQKPYRQKKLRQGDSKSDNQSNNTEGEVEEEGEVEVEAVGDKHTAAAFHSIGFDRPFGHKPFQRIWLRRYEGMNSSEWLTATMEATIQECISSKVTVPPQFFDAKRDVEARENATNKPRVPL